MNPDASLRGAGCAAPADLEAAAEGRFTSAQAHIDSCPVCQHEVANLREFLAADPALVDRQDLAWLEERLRAPEPPARRNRWLSWFPAAPMPRLAFTCAAALLVIAGGLQLRQMAGPSVEDSRSVIVRSGQLKLLAPLGDLETTQVEFQWESLPRPANYEVLVTEVDGAPLWSARTNQPNLSAPASIQQQMLPRKTLLWRVRALNEQGAVIAESSPERIRLLPKN